MSNEKKQFEATMPSGKKVRVYAKDEDDAKDVVDSFAGELPISVVEVENDRYTKG